jgi:uncharacterized coiled-coil protein SlyX
VNAEFPQQLHELIERAKEIRRAGIHGVDPEEYTKQHLIEPILHAIGYDADDVRKQFHILGDKCDYLLERKWPLIFVEAKSLTDKARDLFEAHREQVLRYLRNELDPDGIPQFGLVAEQVEKVNPDLVARDDQGKVNTVRYEAVNAMLLNEFLKEHRKVQEQQATITQVKSTAAKQEATIAQLKKGMEVLTASLKEQASQIQKVSDKVEMSKPAPRTVGNNQ